MDLIISIIGVIITIFLIVGIHEFGHFIVARLCGIKVLKFSIGFGKSLFSWKDKKGTEFTLAAIPLGGYVKMLDESEGTVPTDELPLAYNRQPMYKRIAVIIAGPLFNFIFAFFIYWVIFISGYTTIAPFIDKLVPNSIAAKAGLRGQNEIIKIDGRPTNSWSNIMIRLSQFIGSNDKLTIETKPANGTISSIYTLNLDEWKMDGLRPDPLKSLGIIPYQPIIPAIIGTIQPGSFAEKSLLKVGDTIISIGNKPIKDWEEAMSLITTHPGKTIIFEIKRHNKTLNLPITIDTKQKWFSKYGFLGISPSFTWPKEFIRYVQYNPLTALTYAAQNTYDFIYLNFLLLGKMLTGKVSLLSLGGPISIFQGAGSAANSGLLSFLSFIAFLSIAIGVINVLPIPGLDGGYLLFYLIEILSGRPVSPNLQLLFIRIGLIILMIIMVQALSNDIMRL